MHVQISSRLDHPRYLNEEDSSDTEIESMNEYMSRVGVPIVETCQVPAGNPRDRYTFVQELHRSHLKIIVEFICDLHEKNLSLDGSFQVSNIVFLRDELKFCGLKFAHRLQDEDRQRDLRFLHHVIKNLVQTYNKGDNGQLPTPINHLLSVIEKYRYIYSIFCYFLLQLLSLHNNGNYVTRCNTHTLTTLGIY